MSDARSRSRALARAVGLLAKISLMRFVTARL